MSTPGELLEALGRQARSRLAGGGEQKARTYRGRSVEELIPQIQRELGPEAIVVRRREGLTGGVLGFFQHAYVEIEAMPGAPGVDLYDEEHLPPAAGEPVGPPAGPPPPSAFQPAAPAPMPVSAMQARDPAGPTPGAVEPPYTATGASAQLAPPASAAFPPAPPQSVPPAPPANVPQWPAPSVQPPVPGAPSALPDPLSSLRAPPPPPPPDAAAGSAYVTAHLATLARASRARANRRDPAVARRDPSFAMPEPTYRRVVPSAAAPPSAPRPAAPRPAASRPSPPAASPARRDPERLTPTPPTDRPVMSGPSGGAPSARAEPPEPPTVARAEVERERSPWSEDYQELTPSELPELYRPIVERAAPLASEPDADERRVVAPGSHGRARAGVARSLQRYGISEQLADELIEAAGAHALALAPRAGLAQGVRATLAQRIPVAPPLPNRGAAIVVVGAGGAGKTTCCAALLGAYRKSSTLPASFATITRSGEQGELRMILSPQLVKPTPARGARAVRALARARKEGVAVLDTPSLSPVDRAGVRELASLLGQLQPERVVVALPATLGAAAAAQLLQALRPLGANALAVTHADETDQIGVAIEAACAFALAPEYVLDRARGGGWRLSRVDPASLAARLLP